MSNRNDWRHWQDDGPDLPSIEKIRHRHSRQWVNDRRMQHEHARMTQSGFACCNCKRWVEANPAISGVNHRNHCPYCLHSKHLDASRPGDRLSACHGSMRPVGLTIKRIQKKYIRSAMGELMLIHQCELCGKLSINRIAADDYAEFLLQVFNNSAVMLEELRNQITSQGICLLGENDLNTILTRLYGCGFDFHERRLAIRVDGLPANLFYRTTGSGSD